MSSIQFNKMTASPALASKKYRTWDLRRVEEYKNFGTTYLDYKVLQDEPINLTTHFDTPQQNVDMTKRCLTKILTEIIADVMSRGFDDDNVTHIFMHLQGLDTDFAFIDSGENAKSLQNFHIDPSTIRALVDKFALIIQSGKPVILDGRTTIRVAVFEPPRETNQTTIPMFVGAGWGQNNGRFFESFSVDDFIQKTDGIVQIKNSDNLCMPRALVVGVAFLNKDKDNTSKNFYKNIRAPIKNGKPNTMQQNEAVKLCRRAGVDHTKACDKTDLEKFALHLNMNIEVFEFRHTFLDNVYSSHYVKDRPDLFLLYNSEQKHYHCINNINAVARAVKNNRRLFCKDCRKIVTPFDRSEKDKAEGTSYHNCIKPGETPKHEVINGEVLFYEPDYDLYDASTDLSDDGFIKVNDRKQEPIPTDKVWYFDFETMNIGKHKETEELENLPYEWQPFEPFTDEYRPYPYTPRVFDKDYFYTHEVDYAVIQSADGAQTYDFRNIEDFCEFLTQPHMKGAYLVAHYGQGFDFQLLYNYMFRYSGMLHGKVKDPIMRGQKIIKGYLFNEITLIDSYNYISQSLSTMPKMFGFEELNKGYFPHYFNLPPFQEYVGPLPDKEWYGYMEMKPKQQEDFLKWYNKQIEEKVIFDFKEEMHKYCLTDVDILRRGMQRLRQLFIEMEDINTGKPLGSDPLIYMTIASLAYDGVYRRHYLEPNTIKYVGRPKRGNYSVVSIEWMEHLMATENIFIQHAENSEEFEVILTRPSGERYKKKVDGYDRNTNTVYEFMGCFHHSCKRCYQHETPHPLKCNPHDKEKRILHGSVYATTMRVVEDIKNAGYNIVIMWECDWRRMKNKKKLTSKVDLIKRLPLNPRDAYYGGRTNAVSLYKKVTGDEKIHYIDVVSMYPTVMALPQYQYPIGQHEVRRFDDPEMLPVPLEELFGFQKCHVVPPNNLYHPVLPERSECGKLLFPLYPITGTWTHVELQKAVSLGYVIDEVYEQHHFPPSNRTNTLFHPYIQTFFDMKKKAEEDKNPGLKQVAKLCLNSFYGKFGFNVENQSNTKIIRSHKQLWNIVHGSFKRATADVINNSVAIGTFHSNDEYTTHQKSNVYIAAYVTAYARLKLYEALEILQDKVLYFDTDSVVYCSPTGEHLVPISDSGALGTWSDELKDTPGDYFTEFVSSGPKTYAMKSRSGKNDVCKSKGFQLSVKNREIFNFESLKDQILHKASGGEFTLEDMEADDEFDPLLPISVEIAPRKKQKLVMHRNEQLMVRNKFQLQVRENPGKILHLGYDKRCIIIPQVPTEKVTEVKTLPFGHVDIYKRKFVEDLGSMDIANHICSFL